MSKHIEKNHLVSQIVFIFILDLTYNYVSNINFIYYDLIFIYFTCKTDFPLVLIIYIYIYFFLKLKLIFFKITITKIIVTWKTHLKINPLKNVEFNKYKCSANIQYLCRFKNNLYYLFTVIFTALLILIVHLFSLID